MKSLRQVAVPIFPQCEGTHLPLSEPDRDLAELGAAEPALVESPPLEPCPLGWRQPDRGPPAHRAAWSSSFGAVLERSTHAELERTAAANAR